MERIRDNITFGNFAICKKCGKETRYDFSEVKGDNPQYIICPSCGEVIFI